MKYVLTWKRRRHGTAAEYEAGRRRVLDLMRDRRPEGVRIQAFVVKLREPGGYVLFEADDLDVVRRHAEAFPSLNLHIEPVADVEETPAAPAGAPSLAAAPAAAEAT